MNVSKKFFISEVDAIISLMKNENHRMFCCKYIVACNNEKSDVELEFWDITFYNSLGNKFSVLIDFKQQYKNKKTIQTIEYPIGEMWNNKKEFLLFLDRECDK